MLNDYQKAVVKATAPILATNGEARRCSLTSTRASSPTILSSSSSST